MYHSDSARIRVPLFACAITTLQPMISVFYSRIFFVRLSDGRQKTFTI